MSDADLEYFAKRCPRLEVAKFWIFRSGCGFMSEKGPRTWGNGFPKLAEVWFFGEGRADDLGVSVLVHSAANLKSLFLGNDSLITDEPLRVIGSASSIDSLKLVSCCSITDRALEFLADGNTSETLKRLDLVRCDRITEIGIVRLSSKMCILEHLQLSLSVEQKFTDVGCVAISRIKTLKVLELNGSLDVSEITIFALAGNSRNFRRLSFMGYSRANINGNADAYRHLIPSLTHCVLQPCDI